MSPKKWPSLNPNNAGFSFHEAVVLGFMPNRRDFEVEADNEAEVFVSRLPGGPVMNPDEDELDAAMKAAQVRLHL